MNVFMFHFGRCGSTVLADSINQIPGFVWHGEIFSRGVFVYKGFENTPWHSKQGDGKFTLDEFIEYINVAKSGLLSRTSHKPHYGCEIKGYHFEYNNFNFSLDEALARLEEEFDDCKFIFLWRENSLRRIISSLTARETKLYHSTQPVSTCHRLFIQLDYFRDFDLNSAGDIVDVLENSAQKEKLYINCTREHDGLILSYEQHIEPGVVNAINIICDKFGLNRINPTVRLHKTNPGSISNSVANIEELQQRLSGTRFCQFLSDVPCE